METGHHAMCVGLALLLTFTACARTAKTPNPRNELPFGYVDIPSNGKTVGRMVHVGGWAMDDSAVAAIRIYVDDALKGVTDVGLSRPDVSKAFPKYVHGSADAVDRHGWQAAVDLGDQAGPHTIRVQAFDDEGASRDLGSVVVNLIGRE
jgi:hypothetical protein